MRLCYANLHSEYYSISVTSLRSYSDKICVYINANKNNIYFNISNMKEIILTMINKDI